MNEKDQPSPEQLLKMLDLQMETSRRMRETRSGKRSSMRGLSIAIILIVTMGALWALMMILEEMRPEKTGGDGAPVPAEKR
jgi:hypothetical protein